MQISSHLCDQPGCLDTWQLRCLNQIPNNTPTSVTCCRKRPLQPSSSSGQNVRESLLSFLSHPIVSKPRSKSHQLFLQNIYRSWPFPIISTVAPLPQMKSVPSLGGCLWAPPLPRHFPCLPDTASRMILSTWKSNDVLQNWDIETLFKSLQWLFVAPGVAAWRPRTIHTPICLSACDPVTLPLAHWLPPHQPPYSSLCMPTPFLPQTRCSLCLGVHCLTFLRDMLSYFSMI